MAAEALKAHPASPDLFSFFLSVFMSGIVSFVVPIHHIGLSAASLVEWLPAWAFSFAVALPTVLLVNPIVRSIVNRIISVVSD
ncbi:MAG: DUF2798 domain-containing protein [Gammaproteobacteria bacterium]